MGKIKSYSRFMSVNSSNGMKHLTEHSTMVDEKNLEDCVITIKFAVDGVDYEFECSSYSGLVISVENAKELHISHIHYSNEVISLVLPLIDRDGMLCIDNADNHCTLVCESLATKEFDVEYIKTSIAVP